MESRCSDRQDTVCLPCKLGFYNEYQNYDRCKPCTQCNQREHQPRPHSTHTLQPRGPRRRTRPKPQWDLLHRGSLGAPEHVESGGAHVGHVACRAKEPRVLPQAGGRVGRRPRAVPGV